MQTLPALSLDERLNAFTHAFGFVLSTLGLGLLLMQPNEPMGLSAIFACLIFGLSLMLLYASSTLYHLARRPHLKAFWKRCDHIAIFFLIAGSYTPFCLVMQPSPEAYQLLTVVWALAGVGALLKIFYAGRLRWLSTFLYLALGWMVIWKWDVILANMQPQLLAWLVAGGLLYSLGALFYLWKGLRFHHAIWHLFVLGGSTCHYLAVLFYFS
jgi:hemolysin III